MTTLADRVGEALVERIVSGAMAPGQRLDEHALASEFSVSRTPVREALRRLTSTGLVEVRARRGAIVACPDAAMLAESFETLSELEALCAGWAASRMRPGERAALEACHTHMAGLVRAGDRESYREANRSIHEIVYAGAHNRSLAELVWTLNRRLSPFRGAQFEGPERLARSHAEHGRVVTAILRGETSGAAIAMREHIGHSAQSWQEMASRLTNAPPLARVSVPAN